MAVCHKICSRGVTGANPRMTQRRSEPPASSSALLRLRQEGGDGQMFLHHSTLYG